MNRPRSDSPLYPLQFSPIYKEKVWGGRRLAQLGRTLPGDDRTLIGESWELADLRETAVSGGGGGSERSIIANGPLTGQTLNQAMTALGDQLLGRLEPTETNDFPLLVKFLDARENLSVQVHPNPTYASKHTDAHLKSEAWYIVDAEPGAVIYKGLQSGVEPSDLRAAIEQNDPAAVTPLLHQIPVKRGDCHYLPSGTCHALGAGVLVAEVQTPSDTTFRVFDWGRVGRELHIDPAMQCIDFGLPNTQAYEKRSHIAGVHTTVSKLVDCEHFRIEKIRMSQDYEQELPYDQPAVWMLLEGRGEIRPNNGADDVAFAQGQTMLIPANLGDAVVRLHEDTIWLEITFPKTRSDLLA